MWLINVETLRLEGFLEANLPAYAILSHTWGPAEEELSFKDIQEGNTTKPGIGATKLQGCRQQARQRGLKYMWIDTCCINKADLSELSESINSMFRWYQSASEGYVYLHDVRGSSTAGDDEQTSAICDGNLECELGCFRPCFLSSRWFRRGWTLQELLATSNLRFFDQAWQSLGTKHQMREQIRRITQIPWRVLIGMQALHELPVATRMSWAARRETTKAEDRAYCLLGIFGVSMPMNYEEGGEEAFYRLQEQILKSTPDASILVWDFVSTDIRDNLSLKHGRACVDVGSELVHVGPALASSTASFPDSALEWADTRTAVSHSVVDISGWNLRVSLPLYPLPGGGTLALLDLRIPGKPRHVVAIPLAKPEGGVAYVRPLNSTAGLLRLIEPLPPPTTIDIRTRPTAIAGLASKTANPAYWWYGHGFDSCDLDVVEVQDKVFWDKQNKRVSLIGEKNILVRIRHRKPGSLDFVLVLSTSVERQYSCHLYVCHANTPTNILRGSMSFPFIMSRATGRNVASNGMVTLKVSANTLDENPLLVELVPEISQAAACSTVDATLMIRQLGEMIILQDSVIRMLGFRRQTTQRNAARGSDHPTRRLLSSWLQSVMNSSREQGCQHAFVGIDMNGVVDWAYKNGHSQFRDEIWALDPREDHRAYDESVLPVGVAAGQVGNVDTTAKAIWFAHHWIATTFCSSGGGYRLLRVPGGPGNDAGGRGPLCWAAMVRNTSAIPSLAYKYDVNEPDCTGSTPLAYAIRGGTNVNVVSALLRAGAEVNKRDGKDGAGDTPLMMTATVAIARLLLGHGADPTIRDGQGRTALDRMNAAGFHDMVRVLSAEDYDLCSVSGEEEDAAKERTELRDDSDDNHSDVDRRDRGDTSDEEFDIVVENGIPFTEWPANKGQQGLLDKAARLWENRT